MLHSMHLAQLNDPWAPNVAGGDAFGPAASLASDPFSAWEQRQVKTIVIAQCSLLITFSKNLMYESCRSTHD